MKHLGIVFVSLCFLFLASCGEISSEKKENGEISKSENLPAAKQSSQDENQAKEPMEENTIEEMNTTMMELYKKGKPYTCTFQAEIEGQKYDGTMSLDGKKMRYALSGEMQGQKFENTVILKDGYSYSWTNMGNTGYKMKESEDENQEDSSESEMQAEEMNQKVNFSCKKGVDTASFELPQNIVFEEMPEFPN